VTDAEAVIKVFCIDLEAGISTVRTNAADRKMSRDAAQRRDAYAWLWPIEGLVSGGAKRFEARGPQASSGWEDWPGPTFPGWSVGRARLTLNQD
jgi:hypothetical protein